MAVRNGNNNQSNAAGATTAQATPQPSAQAAPQHRPITISNFRPLLSRSGDAAGTAKFTEAFRQLLASDPQRFSGYRVLNVNNSDYNILLSSILICGSGQAANGRQFVVVHAMMVECSAGRLPKRTIQLGNNQTIEIDLVPGDAKDQDMWEIIKQAVYTSYGPNVDVYSADMNVIPTEMQPTDNQAIRDMLIMGLEAVYRITMEYMGNKEIFSVDAIPPSQQLVARVDTAPPPAAGENTLPIRSDIAIELTGYDRNSNSKSQFANKETNYATIDGYIDLNYVRPEPMGYGMPAPTQHYVPEFRITKLTSDLGALTPEIVLFALVNAAILNHNRTWALAFRQKVARDNPLRDLGAIGCEVPALTADQQPGQIRVADASFSQEDLDHLVSTAIHQNLMISMDIDEAGPDTWLLKDFLEAAAGDPNAVQRVNDAAMNLTNGKFIDVCRVAWPEGNGNIPVPFYDNVNRIPKGWYGPETAKRPFDDIDYLAYLNLYGPKGRVDAAAEWERTNIADGPLEVRLDRRLRMMRDVLEDGMHLKGFARRITINPTYLICLDRAIRAAGLDITAANLAMNNGQTVRRTMNSMIGMTIDPRALGSAYAGRPNQQFSHMAGMPGRGWGI